MSRCRSCCEKDEVAISCRRCCRFQDDQRVHSHQLKNHDERNDQTKTEENWIPEIDKINSLSLSPHRSDRRPQMLTDTLMRRRRKVDENRNTSCGEVSTFRVSEPAPLASFVEHKGTFWGNYPPKYGCVTTRAVAETNRSNAAGGKKTRRYRMLVRSQFLLSFQKM